MTRPLRVLIRYATFVSVLCSVNEPFLQATSYPSSPTPSRYRTRSTPAEILVTAPFANIETPQRANTTPIVNNNYYKSPLPASSPPPHSSPFSSPNKRASTRVVNLVSSPGPMGPPPSESDYPSLPYTLPPGPYSTKKPDLSYAALVGRAILASPQHALTLQEIYNYITLVYPHFKRGETTWMNSIRHVLSTTACFRKHTRERSVGRTLWAIWDCDLECFKNGGFNKTHCKDMMDGKKAASSTGAAIRKRAGEEGGERKPKRQKKSASARGEGPDTFGTSTLPPLAPASQLHPLFPTTRPTTHHQSYYESCVVQQQQQHMQMQSIMPAEMIFPPLPPSGYQRIEMAASTSFASTSYGHEYSSVGSEPYSSFDSEPSRTSSPPPPPPTSSSSPQSFSIPMPELTPNGSSSSPPLPCDDHPDAITPEACGSPALVYPDGTDDNADMNGPDDNKLFSEMLSADALEPGFTLSKFDYYQSIDKGKRKAGTPPKVCLVSSSLARLFVANTYMARPRCRNHSLCPLCPLHLP